MGAMHETFTPITAKDIAKREGVNIATIRFRWNANYAKGTFDSNRELSPEQVEALSRSAKASTAKKSKAAPRTPAPVVLQPAPDYIQPAPETPGAPDTPPARQGWRWPTWATIRRVLFEVLAIAIVCGHGFLIWQEAAELFGYIGNIGGAVIFAIVCLAVLIASDSSRNRTSLFALWFMVFVDAAAGFVHYEALRTPVVPDAMTVGFCIFICASSFVALLLFRDSKLD